MSSRKHDFTFVGLSSLPSRGLFLILALAMLAPLGGCGHFRFKSDAPAPVASLSIQLDKASYRPGELVQISVRMSNASGKTMSLRNLDSGSVVFFLSRRGDQESMERRAVSPRTEQLGAMKEIPTSGTLERRFYLTRLTFYSGPMKVLAIYDPNSEDARVAGGRLAPKAYSNTVAFQVEGEPMFAREPNSGLITSDDAKRLAAQKARASGRQGAEAVEIVSVQDNEGYDIWWVNVKAPNTSGIDELTGWMVSPYTGSVRQTRVPFDSKMALDKRLIRKSAPKAVPPKAPAPVGK